MNISFWILGIILVFIAILLAISYLRAQGPHSKKMAAEQAHLNRKMGTKIETPPTVGGAEGSLKRIQAKLGSWIWEILLVSVGLAIFYFGIHTSSLETPHLADVNNWSWEHWPWILILWGILAALFALNAGKATKTLQGVLMWTVFMLFIGFPIWTWLITPSKPATSAHISCPDVSAYQTRKCDITAEWSNEVKLADGPEANGKNFCTFPMMQYERRDEDGTTFWRFKTSSGRAEMKYRLFPAGEQCPNVL